MARPTKRTPALVEQILSALRAGNTRTAAAGYAGINRATLARWLCNAAFFAQVTKAEADAEVRHVANIAKAAAGGSWTASAWWLEHRARADWGREPPVDLRQIVAEMAQETGMNDEEAAAALVEAERIIRARGRS